FSSAFDVGAGSTKSGVSPSITMMWQSVGQPWAIGAVSLKTATPTEARLSSFTATDADAGRVRLAWQTGFETDNLGFNVYREQAGRRTRLNGQLIAGSALLAGPGVRLRSGHSYSWSDALPADKETRYWLEEISLDGLRTWHGPVSVEPGVALP